MAEPMKAAAGEIPPGNPHPSVPPAPPPPDSLLRPMLRAGRWVILLSLTGVLLPGRPPLDDPAIRASIGAALALYAVLSIVLLRSGALTPLRVVIIAGA